MTAQPRLSVTAYRKTVGRPKETSEQVRLHAFCRAHVTAFCWHTRNEGQRSDLGRIRDVAQGLWSGVADEFGIVECGPHVLKPFAIELKRIGATYNDVTMAQRRFGRMLIERGGLWTWAPGAEAAKAWCYAQGIVRPAGWTSPWAALPEEGDL